MAQGQQGEPNNDAVAGFLERRLLAKSAGTRVASAQMAHARARARRSLPRGAQLQAFLVCLSSALTVSEAAEVAGIPRRTLYNRRERDSEFAAAWDCALEASLGAIEERLRQWVFAEAGGPTLAQVRAAEVLLRLRHPAFRREQAIGCELGVAPDFVMP